MKSETKNLITDVEYPYLRLYHGYCIILFTSPKTGMVVVSYSAQYPLGKYSTEWDTSRFEYLRPSCQVILSND